jgi:putative ABC transport system substrate-binding protein
MRRRDFIVVLGGAAAAWPLATHAQQAERVRRVGLPMAAAADDPECQARIVAFTLRLQQLGWTDSRNVRVDIRWATDPADLRRHAADLAALAPDVIVAATGTTTIAPLLEATRIVPIVFVLAIGPVGAGFVASLSRPGGNATVAQGDRALCVAGSGPSRSRYCVWDRAVRRRPGGGTIVGGGAEPGDVHDEREIERAVTAFARSPNGGLIVTAVPLATRHRDFIIALADRHGLPAVYGVARLRYRWWPYLLWA